MTDQNFEKSFFHQSFIQKWTIIDQKLRIEFSEKIGKKVEIQENESISN